MRVLLVGNANVGKTSVFNALTNSDNHVGNWHGVTVTSSKKSILRHGEDIEIIDLPGLYSLVVDGGEEAVSAEAIRKRDYDCIINICEVSNLARNLYLTYQLLNEGVPMILAINMVDELKKTGRNIDFVELENRLGIPVLPISARKAQNLDNLLQRAVDIFKKPIKATKGDRYSFRAKDSEELAEQIYNAIDNDLDGIITSTQDKSNYVHGISQIDRILLNKYLALPIFLIIMGAVFFVTFGFVGKLFSDVLGYFIFDIIAVNVKNALDYASVQGWISALVSDGIIGGLGGILVFLPQILLLYLFLAVLEDSGYMSRVAFMTDGLFSKLGLSGKSAFTMLMGFGCSATAILTARNLEDKNIRLKTILLTPFMSCSARLPIFATLGAYFFLGGQAFIIFGLYLLGIVIALLIAFILNKIPSLKTDSGNFIMEMPPYRIPQAMRVARLIWTNIKAFLIRIGTLIFAVNVIVWIISNFSFTEGYLLSSLDNSIMASLAGAIAFIFLPLGFGNWKAATAILSGLVAKEVVVTALGSLGTVSEVFGGSSAAAISFMIFTLLYIPCVATIGAIQREAGGKWALISALINLTTAYLVSLIVYQGIRIASIKGGGYILGIIIAGIIFLFTSIVLIKDIIKKFTNKSVCIGCNGNECGNNIKTDCKNKRD